MLGSINRLAWKWKLSGRPVAFVCFKTTVLAKSYSFSFVFKPIGNLRQSPNFYHMGFACFSPIYIFTFLSYLIHFNFIYLLMFCFYHIFTHIKRYEICKMVIAEKIKENMKISFFGLTKIFVNQGMEVACKWL